MLCPEWSNFLNSELTSEYGSRLKAFIRQERENYTIFPQPKDTFAAFELTPFASIKAVILGQDPYHGLSQATGLAFSIPSTLKRPPSLENIIKEYVSDLALKEPDSGDLTKWASEGVLLLNTTLTVKQSSPMSHVGMGWENLTAAAIKKINDELSDVVFILWGKHASSIAEPLIDAKKHHILKAPHPSPLSSYRGFFGSKPFSNTNSILISAGKQPINWVLN